MSASADDDGSSVRAQVLGAVRSHLNVRGDEAGRRGRVRARLEQPELGLIPARAKGTPEELCARMAQMLEQQNALVRFPGAPDALLPAIHADLLQANLPQHVRTGTAELFESLAWDSAPSRSIGPARPNDFVSLSHALAGAAETGTLFLVSGPENPSTLNFLPEVHMVVLRREDIVGSYEKAWARLRSVYGRGRMPRTVNLISAPSRTADIEQTLIKGAHGPKQLFVYIID
jgi:L-lactate dehydrogenase complex protein LldG